MPSPQLRVPRIAFSALAVVLALVTAGVGRADSGTVAQPQPLANVRGVVWYDDAGTGRRQGGEPLAPGAQIVVRPDPGLPTIYANGDGAFAFSVPEGAYTIEAWWDGPEVTSRSPGGPGAAYFSTTVDLLAGTTHDLSLGVRPTGRFPARVDAKIEVVWPHGYSGQLAPVAQAPLANVMAYLFHASTRQPVPCSYSPRVDLVAAVDDRPGEVVANGVKRTITMAGRSFPIWEFNNVDVSAAQDPKRRVYFWLKVADDLTPDEDAYAEPRFRSNVWAHGLDGRTYSPQRMTPVGTDLPDRLTARVDVVWPQDGAGHERPVDRARFANVDVLLLDADSPNTSVSPSYNPDVWLLKSLDGGPAEVIRGRRVLIGQQSPTYPKWVFEDVDVGEARDPTSRYYFRVAVAGRSLSTNVWAHGVDGRTYFPDRDVPAASGLDCP